MTDTLASTGHSPWVSVNGMKHIAHMKVIPARRDIVSPSSISWDVNG